MSSTIILWDDREFQALSEYIITFFKKVFLKLKKSSKPMTEFSIREPSDEVLFITLDFSSAD
jgi:hypothetical protein